MFKKFLILLAICSCTFCKDCRGTEALRPSEHKCSCPEKHLLARESQHVLSSCPGGKCPRMKNHIPVTTPSEQAQAIA